MPDQETTIQQTATGEAAAAAPVDTLAAYEPVAEDEQEEWDEEPIEELSPRPRRRLLGVSGNGAGGNLVFLALLGVLLIACGFIGGVLVEKGQTSSSSSSGAVASLASRFATLRGGASGAGASSATGGSGTTGSTGASGFGAGAGATAGSVAYVSDDTLYVTNSEGNTVKVTTSAASTVTKTVKSSVKGIHPGETVVVTGAAGANGAINAESIRVGGNGGGLGALFAGAGASGGGRSAGTTGNSGSGGGPALFGNGG